MVDQNLPTPLREDHAELRHLLVKAEALARHHSDPLLSILLRRTIIRASFDLSGQRKNRLRAILSERQSAPH